MYKRNTCRGRGASRAAEAMILSVFLLCLFTCLCYAEPEDPVDGEEAYIAYSPYMFYSEPADDANFELPLGDLITDAYLYEAELQGKPSEVAVLSARSIRGPLIKGVIAEESLSEVLPEFPLLTLYFTGEELELMAEEDFTEALGLRDIRLYFSGIRYTAESPRLFLNDIALTEYSADGKNYEPIEKNRLYAVVVDRWSLDDILAIYRQTNGFLKIKPKTESGEEIGEDAASLLKQCLRDASGNMISSRDALSSYLKSFEIYTQGLPGVSRYYSETRGRKLFNDDASYKNYLSNLNSVGKLICGLVIFAFVLVIVIVYLIIKKLAAKRKPKVVYVNNLKFK